MVQTIIYVYLSVAAIGVFINLVFIMFELDPVLHEWCNGFWDFIVYCLLWGVYPIKSIIKFFKNII